MQRNLGALHPEGQKRLEVMKPWVLAPVHGRTSLLLGPLITTLEDW